MENTTIKRGDVFFADLDPVIGSEQGGIRPVLVLQNDIGNKYSGTTIIAPLTTEKKAVTLPTHTFISSKNSCLKKNSWVLLEQIKTIDKVRLRAKIGSLNEYYMRKIDRHIEISLGLGGRKNEQK